MFLELDLKRIAKTGLSSMLAVFLACPSVALANEPVDEPDRSAQEETGLSFLSAREEGECGANASWEISWDGVLRIFGSGPIEDIPDEWFQLRDDIVTINIEEGITSIPDDASGAFFAFDSLAKVTLPSTLEYVGKGAFWSCASLRSIDLPEGLQTIGKSAFEGTALTSVDIPESLTSIGEGCFEDCADLASVKIGSGLKSIPAQAFKNCSSLENLSISDSVESIGEDAFYSCDSLETIEIPESCREVGEHAFAFCSSLTEVSLKDGVESIGSGAFSNCAIESVTLPESLTRLEDAFPGCDSLESVEFLGKLPEGAADALSLYDGMVVFPAGELTWTEDALAEFDSGTQFYERNADGSLSKVEFYAPTANERIQLTEGKPSSYTFEKTLTAVSFDFTLESAATVNFVFTHYMGSCVHEMMSASIVDSTGKEVLDFGILNYLSPNAISRKATLPAGEYHWEVSFLDSHHDSTYTTVSVSYYVEKLTEPENPSDEATFNDIEGHWAEEFIEEAAAQGLIYGFGDGSFRPDDQLTRGQLAVILFRASGDTAPIYGYSGYLDVPNGQWYTDAIVWASREGIVSGYNETEFGPDDYVTREQACKMIALFSKTRGFDIEDPDFSTIDRFVDKGSISPWAIPYVAWMVETSIISGYSEEGQDFVNPLGTASRAEMAKIIVGALSLDPTEQEGFRYPEGEYVVGKDIPAGEYAFFGTSDERSGYVCAYANAQKSSIVENENFDTTYYITVENGQLLKVSRGEFVPSDQVPIKLETVIGNSEEIIGDRMYKVGVDIAAGTYALQADGSGYDGYYCVYPSSEIPLDIVENDLFSNNAYVTVKEGQYLLINNCSGTKE